MIFLSFQRLVKKFQLNCKLNQRTNRSLYKIASTKGINLLVSKIRKIFSVPIVSFFEDFSICSIKKKLITLVESLSGREMLSCHLGGFIRKNGSGEHLHFNRKREKTSTIGRLGINGLTKMDFDIVMKLLT